MFKINTETGNYCEDEIKEGIFWEKVPFIDSEIYLEEKVKITKYINDGYVSCVVVDGGLENTMMRMSERLFRKMYKSINKESKYAK